MDDVWNTKVWDDLRMFFPNNMNVSRVILTTRLSNVAISLSSHNPYLIDFLDEDKSWNLFCEKAFAQESCPLELEEIGKNITKSCRGLPLAIVVIDSLLSKSNTTQEHWEFVAKNVSSFANSGDDDHCLNILSLSYNNLPLHLKPCFLYMQGFPTNDEIKVSKLIKLWVAEGFLKPKKDKNLEEVAKKYLMDLIDRNLILIGKRKHSGKIKTRSIHNLLRDSCIKESQKEHFYCDPKSQLKHPFYRPEICFLCCSDQDTSTRIYIPQGLVASQPTSPLSSCLLCDACRIMYPQRNRIRLATVVRVIIKQVTGTEVHEFQQPAKSRYLHFTDLMPSDFVFTSIHLLCNLQILDLVVHGHPLVLPSDVWELPQLRHLMIKDAIFPDCIADQIDRKDSIVLENLQTLSSIKNFRWSEEVVERIPNLKKLKIRYYSDSEETEWSYYSLCNLALLRKLETLVLHCKIFTSKTVLPHSLTNLSLWWCKIRWEEITIIGLLPNLEVLKLQDHAFEGLEWNPVEGEFIRLKLLLIQRCKLLWWGAEKVHFSNHEILVLRYMDYLEKIHSGIGEIVTLHSIHLHDCNKSIVKSAKEILEEQQSLGNEDLQLHVTD